MTDNTNAKTSTKSVKWWMVVASIIFAVWMIFFDDHNMIQHHENQQKLSQLLNQKQYLREKVEHDRQRMKELQTNQSNLEKFAREQFFMKKKNEDIFLIVEQ